MEINGFEINTIFVERSESEINLYGAHLVNLSGPLVVVRSTKNMPNLAQQLYGHKYTNASFIEKLKDHPSHNFVGNIASPVSACISMSKVIFVD